MLVRLRAVSDPTVERGGMPSGRQSRYPFRGLIDAIGRWFSPNPDSEAVTTRVLLDGSPEAVWKALRFYEEIPIVLVSSFWPFFPGPSAPRVGRRRSGPRSAACTTAATS